MDEVTLTDIAHEVSEILLPDVHWHDIKSMSLQVSRGVARWRGDSETDYSHQRHVSPVSSVQAVRLAYRESDYDYRPDQDWEEREEKNDENDEADEAV